MKYGVRALAAVAGLGLAGSVAAGAAFAAPAAPAASSPAATVAHCRTSQLSVSLRNSQGAAGYTTSDVTVRNVSGATCSVGGFPGVSYVKTKHGRQVGAAATRSGSSGSTVTLSPGHSAAALLKQVDPLNYPSGTCHLTKVSGLRVYPPNDVHWLYLRQSSKECGNRALKNLAVQAFVPAS